jgi:hypothetical protein
LTALHFETKFFEELWRSYKTLNPSMLKWDVLCAIPALGAITTCGSVINIHTACRRVPDATYSVSRDQSPRSMEMPQYNFRWELASSFENITYCIFLLTPYGSNYVYHLR